MVSTAQQKKQNRQGYVDAEEVLGVVNADIREILPISQTGYDMLCSIGAIDHFHSPYTTITERLSEAEDKSKRMVESALTRI